MLAMVLQSLLGLALVLGLFALVVWGTRRFQQQRGGMIRRDFSVVGRLHLDHKHSLVEVRHEGRHYLLGISPAGMVQLHGDQSITQAATRQSDEGHE